MSSLLERYNGAKAFLGNGLQSAENAVGNAWNQHVVQPVQQEIQAAPSQVKNYFGGVAGQVGNQFSPMGTGAVGQGIDYANQHIAQPLINDVGTFGRSAVGMLTDPGIAQDEMTPQGMSQRQYNQNAVNNFATQGRTDLGTNIANMVGQTAPLFVPGVQGQVVGTKLGDQLGNNGTNNNLFSSDSAKDIGQAGLNLIPGATSHLTQGFSAVPKLITNLVGSGTENVLRGQGSSLIEDQKLKTDPKAIATDFGIGVLSHGLTHPGEVVNAANDTAQYGKEVHQNIKDAPNLASATHTLNAEAVDPHTTMINGVPVHDPGVESNTKIRVPEPQAEAILRNHNNVPPVEVNNMEHGNDNMVDITIGGDRQVKSWTPDREGFGQEITKAAKQGQDWHDALNSGGPKKPGFINLGVSSDGVTTVPNEPTSGPSAAALREFDRSGDAKKALQAYQDEHSSNGTIYGGEKRSQQAVENLIKKYRTTPQAEPTTTPTIKNIAPQDPQAAALAQNHADVPLTNELPQNTGTGSDVQERKFITRAKTSPDVSAEAQNNLEGNYTPRKNTELLQTVQDRIAQDPQAAHDFALKTNSDEGTATAIELAKQYRESGQHDLEANLINEKAKQLTEAGRTIQAARMMASLSPEGQAMTLARDIQSYNEKNPSKAIPELTPEQTKDITSRAETIQNMPDGTKAEKDAKGLAQQKLWEHMADQLPDKHSWIDKLLAIRRTGLLTGPKTVIKVLGGHVLHGATEGVSNLIGTGIDKGIGALGGQRSTTFTPGDVGGSLKEGITNTGNTLVKGYDPNATYQSIKNNRINWGDSPAGKFLQAYTEGVGRLHQALPEVSKSLTVDASLHSQAGAEAENQGLKGQAKADFIKNLVANPTEDMNRIANSEAEHQTFQNKTRASELLASARKVPVIGKAAEFLVPFTKVPSAVGTEIINYSPVGAVKTVIEAVQAKGANGWTPEIQRAFVQGLGRSITGTALLAMGAKLAQSGIISGQYPADQKTRNQWEAEGKTPNSILLDGKWRSLGAFGPSGSALAVGAAYTAGLDGTQKKPGDQVKALLATGGAAAATQADQPYLQGISQVADVLKDPQRSSLSFAKSTANSFVPTAVSTTATATDPLQRQTPDIMSSVQSKIPILREQLPAKTDALGQPVPQSDSTLEKFLDPTNPSTARMDGAVGDLSNLASLGYNSTPTKIGTSITIGKQKVALSQDQQNSLNTEIGQKTNEAYQGIFSSPGFKDQDPATQQQQLQTAAASVRKGVMDTITASGGVDNYLNGSKSSADTNPQVDKAQLEVAKKQVLTGAKTSVTLGDNYITKDAKGNVVVKSITGLEGTAKKAQYALNLQDATRANNLKDYNTIQEQQLQQLDQQRQALLKDPTLNQAALIQNQNQSQDIQNNLERFNSRGYISKGGGSGRGSVSLGRARSGKSLLSSSGRSGMGLSLKRSAGKIKVLGQHLVSVKSPSVPKIKNLRKA